jgi:hypothetical protein
MKGGGLKVEINYYRPVSYIGIGLYDHL